MSKELDALFARAEAAIADAAQLAAANRHWRAQAQHLTRLRHSCVRFSPKTLKIYSPSDLPEQRAADQAFTPPDDFPNLSPPRITILIAPSGNGALLPLGSRVNLGGRP